MLILKHTPSPLLADFVELFWLRQNAPKGVVPNKEAILPDGCAHLVINLTEDAVRVFERIDGETVITLSGSIFGGPRSSPYAILPAASDVIGVLFRPGGAFPFLSIPAEEFRNAQVPIELIFGAPAADIRDQLLSANTAAKKFALLECFLLRRLARPFSLHRAVAYAIHAFQRNPSPTISDVLGEIGLSERRFSRVFSEQVGLTPKLFHRVQRFQRTISSLPAMSDVDWARTAVDAGYYDQAHLIHEFRSFCSITPSVFIERKIDQRNHLPLQG
jgi:AraC-like DNA-binding protein